MSNVTPFPYAGAIDADGHILEPPGLWENILVPSIATEPISPCVIRTRLRGSLSAQ